MLEDNHIRKIAEGDFSDLKTRLMNAAVEEFAMRSIGGARTREITRKAGANVAAINYHFGSKDELYYEVLCESAEYFDAVVSSYYEAGAKLAVKKDALGARRLLSKFLFDCIRRFGKIELVSHMILILGREEILPSKGYSILFESLCDRPIKFLADLIGTASRGIYARENCLMFGHFLWNNIRSYTRKPGGIVNIFGWKQIGEREISLLENALSSVLDKTLK